MEIDPISTGVLILSALVLLAAFLTFRQSRKQTELLRRTLYGEIYEKPPMERIAFLKLSGKHDKRVRFKQEVGRNLFMEAILPKNSKVPLCITWRFKEKQSLRHVSFGFGLGHDKRPRILRKLKGWAAKVIQPLLVHESIDLNGNYHMEYQIPRRSGRGEPSSQYIAEFEIETGRIGEHDFHVELYSEEAKESLHDTLKVIVE